MNMKDIKELIGLAEMVGDYFDAYNLINDYLGQYLNDDYKYLKKKRMEICILLRDQLLNELKETYESKGLSKTESLWKKMNSDGKIVPEIDYFMKREYNHIITGKS